MITTLVLAFILMVSMFMLIWSAVALIRNKRFFTSAPKDVQNAIIKQRDEKSRTAVAAGYIIAAACLMTFIGAFIYAFYDGRKHDFGYWDFFGRYLLMLYLMQAFDMIFLDWYLLTRSHFYQHYYPETEGCESFKKYGFNLKEQIGKIIAFPFVAGLLAYVCILFS